MILKCYAKMNFSIKKFESMFAIGIVKTHFVLITFSAQIAIAWLLIKMNRNKTI